METGRFFGSRLSDLEGKEGSHTDINSSLE